MPVSGGRLLGVLNALYTPRVVRWLMPVRAVCAALLIAFAIWPFAVPSQIVVVGAVALFLAVSGVTYNMGHPFGIDGSDHMCLVVLATTGCADFIGTPLSAHLALCFVAAQLTLAYATAGVAKMFGGTWRRGSAVGRVLRTATLGNPSIGAILQANPLLGKAVTWWVIAWEMSFPVAFVLPRPAFMVFLGGGVAMHLSIAALMGLNVFLWCFLSAYPSVLYAYEWFRS